MTEPKCLYTTAEGAWLFDSAASRQIESAAAARLPAHALMERAGLALARLVRATAPHARRVWIAAGPGNNGGDGLVLARLLRESGIAVQVSIDGLADPARRASPPDAARALADAQAAGVALSGELPAAADVDLCIDALLGLGQSRPPAGFIAEAVRRLNAGAAPVLAVDVPTGLDSDRGSLTGPLAVKARRTLALLTLKPGLFTGAGRALAGEVWFDRIGVHADEPLACARLPGWPETLRVVPSRPADSHKGRFGDVHVLGGAEGMVGAALLAARAALAAGAGRCFVHLCASPSIPFDTLQPELMLRPAAAIRGLQAGPQATVLAGCGGGEAVAEWLAPALALAPRLVLDADALNAIAIDSMLQSLLRQRGVRGQPTVLTPHPLEAARLLETTAADVQADRRRAVEALSGRYAAVVVLKGSGTLIAAPGQPLRVNPTGDARLSTAGTGDVLAGWTSGLWACQPAAGGADFASAMAQAADVAAAAVFLHGAACKPTGSSALPLLASALIPAMVRAVEERTLLGAH